MSDHFVLPEDVPVMDESFITAPTDSVGAKSQRNGNAPQTLPSMEYTESQSAGQGGNPEDTTSVIEETNAVEGGIGQEQENEMLARRVLLAKRFEKAIGVDWEEADNEQPTTYGQAAGSCSTPMVQREDVKITLPTEETVVKSIKERVGIYIPVSYTHLTLPTTPYV